MTTITKTMVLASVLMSFSIPAMAADKAAATKPTLGDKIEQAAGELQSDISNRLNKGGQMHEISAAGSGLAFGGDQAVSFNLNTAYSYLVKGLLEDNIQGTVAVGLSVQEDNTVVNALVGPTFNYKFTDRKLENSAFLTALAGAAIADAPAGTSTEFAYNVSVGKRFALNDFVTWKPSFGLGKGAGFAKENVSFLIVPVQFSFFL